MALRNVDLLPIAVTLTCALLAAAAATGCTSDPATPVDTSGVGGGGGDAGTGGATEVVDPCSDDARLSVVTFNIRYDDGGFDSTLEENGWLRADTPRRALVLQVMLDLDPDLMGVQEALINQVNDLADALPHYDFVGVGRADGVEAGEFAGIFIRAARFAIIDSGHFWLSETAETPGTVFPGSGATRMASWANLYDKRTERELFILNTHWDHVSGSSRESSASLIRERLATLPAGRPIFVTGDLNAPPSSVALDIFFQEEPDATQLTDGYRLANPDESPEEATFHDFGGGTFGDRIDYVLHDAQLVTVSGAIIRSDFDGRYPSDHFPVSAVASYAADAQGTPCSE